MEPERLARLWIVEIESISSGWSAVTTISAGLLEGGWVVWILLLVLRWLASQSRASRVVCEYFGRSGER
jgi:hypothetical protein